MKLLPILSFLLLFSSFASTGQENEEIKALLEKIENEENDSVKVDLYIEIGKAQINVDTAIFNQYFDPAISLARQIGYKKGEINLLYRKANNIYFYHPNREGREGWLKMANLLYDSVFNMSKKLDYIYGQSCGLNGLGRVQQALKNYRSALKFHVTDLELCLAENDTLGIIISTHNIGFANYYLENYQKAIKYYFLERAYFDSNTPHTDKIDFHYEISRCYFSLNEYQKSIAHLDTLDALLAESKDLTNTAQYYQTLGVKYFEHGKYISAIDVFEKSLKIGEQIQDEDIISDALFYLGEIYLSQNNYSQAIKYFRKSLQYERRKNPNSQISTNCLIGKAHFLNNQIDSARMHYKIITSLMKNKAFNDQLLTSRKIWVAIFKAGLELKSEKLDSALATVESTIAKIQDFSKDPEYHHLYDIKGEALYLNARHTESISAYNKVLNMENKIWTPYFLLKPLEGISKNYEALGDHENEIKYYKQFIQLRDSIQNKYNSERLAKMEFDNLREKQQAEHQTQLAQEERTRNVIIIVSGLLLIILVILYFFYRSKVKSNRKLQALDKEKNKIIGVVAHDLRSPLNSVKGLVNIFKIEDDEKEKERYLGLITTCTERMTDMVNRVLDVSALESKKLDLRSEQVELVELMNQLMVNFELGAEKKNQRIVFQNKCEEATVELDKNYLIQVIENLVSNALKYSEKETTTTLVLENANSKVRLSVLDQGPGISEAEQSLLFKEFSTLTSKTTGGEKATGLGLSIVKKYVEAMKGKIWCESELGQGSSFNVEFSLVRAI